MCFTTTTRKEKIFFANLNEKDTIGNKKIWQTVKPCISEKTKSAEKITLIENENLVSDDAEVANCLNNFFSYFVQNFKILKYEVEDDSHLNMNSHPTLKAVFKYKNHPSIISIRRFHFHYFHFVIKFQILIFLASIKIQF